MNYAFNSIIFPVYINSFINYKYIIDPYTLYLMPKSVLFIFNNTLTP